MLCECGSGLWFSHPSESAGHHLALAGKPQVGWKAESPALGLACGCLEIMKHLVPLNGWGGPKPSAAREVTLSTKAPNLGPEMTVMILEAAPALEVTVLSQPGDRVGGVEGG